jgi:hypothetical protein
MQTRGRWTLMEHFNLFLTFDREGGRRSVGKAESMDWAMFMQQRSVGSGFILFREMLSAEPLTAPHGGYPELFQTGETYHGLPLVDRQHPHNLFSEVSLTYKHPLGADWARGYVYAAPAGEPALGPVAYVHRDSAAEIPQAPLSHHLQDSTHISYGVLTGGVELGYSHNYDVYGAALKLEGSVFNGREPGEKRYSFDFAPMDSWSARVAVRITDTIAGQYSIGHLVHPETAEPGNLTRQTASLHYTRVFREGEHGGAAISWANSLIWGRNQKTSERSPQNSYLLESLLRFRREAIFTRWELVDKDELFPPSQTYPPTLSAATLPLIGRQFRVAAFTFGGDHDLLRRRGVKLALGADFSVYHKPAALDLIYGANPVSFQVFLRLRPAATHMH